MPTKLFHKGSTTVKSTKKSAFAKADPGIPVTRAVADPVTALKRMKNATRMAKPSGSGPRGSAGYFDNN